MESASKKSSKKNIKIMAVLRIFWIAFYCIFWIFCGVIIFTTISMYVTKNKRGIPSTFGYSVINISTGSMISAGFNKGSYALIRSCEPENLKKGDYIAFYYYSTPGAGVPSEVTLENQPTDVSKLKGKAIYFHEIINFIESDGHKWFVTKGTDNKSPDNFLIYDEYVIGKYNKTGPALDSILYTFMSPLGRILIIACPASILIASDIYRLIIIHNEFRKIKDKTKKIKLSDIPTKEEKEEKEFKIKLDSSLNILE